MTTTSDLADIVAELRAADRFLVTSHLNPDGDAIGSTLALGYLLEALGKTGVTCMNQDPVPRILQWIAGADRLANAVSDTNTFDTVIVVDVAQRDRLGSVDKRIVPGARIVVIDHHQEQNPCGDVNFVDPSYAAAGEIVADLFDAAGVTMTREAAECIYVAQITDTGGYRFSNTNARSHRIAARLIETGLDVFDINHRVFDIISHPKWAMLRIVLERREFASGGRIAYSFLTRQDMNGAGARDEDLDGLVNYMRNIEGVDVGILFREIDEQTTKVSFRSRGTFNSAAFLACLGGGGHAAAAGATISLPLNETRAVVLDHLPAVLEGLK